MSRESLDFLREQMTQINHKIARLDSAQDACDDDLESASLNAARHNAATERDVLRCLLLSQLSSNAVSLDTQLIRQLSGHHSAARRLGQNWRRGQRTPEAFWDNEVELDLLNTLLSRYHAWVEQRPLYANGSTREPRAFPWNPDQNGSRDFEALYNGALEALWRARYPYDHLDIIAEPGGEIIATGYAHSRAERARVLKLIMQVDGAQQIVYDIRVTPPDRCPICRG